MSRKQQMRSLDGLGASEGIAIGRAVCIEARQGELYRFPLAEDRIDAELERLQEAVHSARRQLMRLRREVDSDLGEELGAIFEAHLLLLEDRAFLDRVEQRIRNEHVNAEWAVHRAMTELAERFSHIEDDYLRERGQDLRDVGGFLLRILQGGEHHELSEIEGDVIIVADDLPPSEAVRLGRENVVGFAIESGGRTSHTTIIARSLKIPAVSGLAGITRLVTDDDPMILDGTDGRAILHPTKKLLATYRRRRTTQKRRDEELLATRDLASTTRDGVTIQLMANIDLPEEVTDVQSFGAAGVGLYRSEFLYIERSPDLPTEEDHLEIYRQLIEASAPHPAIIRTYDLGGRKLAREVMDTQEMDPVLGLRGIRLTMARPEIFKTQLRGLFRAACHGELWVMLPLVSTLEEVRRFREFAGEVMDEMEREGLPLCRTYKLGVMIEVPAAAMIADRLAREVDFFSIGTNDLVQYAMAVDRNNDHVAYLYQPLHPGLLRMLRFVLESAQKAGIEVSVCGEMAASPHFAALLVGMGLRRLSMSPRMVPVVKTFLRGVSTADLADLAEQCKDFDTAAEVECHVDAFLRAHGSTLAYARQPGKGTQA